MATSAVLSAACGATCSPSSGSEHTRRIDVAGVAMSDTLHPYQTDVVDQIERAIAAGERRILLVAPTGSGKTIIGCEIIQHFTQRYRPVIVLAHRKEIIKQTSKKLFASDIRHGIIKAGFSPRPMERVQVASVQTLWVRAMRSEAMRLPPTDLLIVDECHHATATTWRKIIEAYPDAVLIGLTATPCRGDGRGLGGIFTRMIEAPQIPDLIELGYLVKTRVYAPIRPNLRGVRIRRGDYVEGELAERMDNPKLVGDIVTHWHKYGQRRKTVAFACNVAHSLHIRDEFVRSGVRAEHLDGATPDDERDAILARLETGETELVANCMVLTEGWDMPEIACAILARPTRQMGLFRQMIGRVLRPADGKPDAVILDHSGAVFAHGLPEDRVEWTLDPESRATSPAHEARLTQNAGKLLECTQCGALRLGGQACPHCGFLPHRPPRDVFVADGKLGLVTNGRARGADYDPETRQRWHGMFRFIADERGYKPGWVAYKFKEKFGNFPPRGNTPTPIPPTPECRSWVRSRMIAFARSQDP
jgi:DNA repair protein RadD